MSEELISAIHAGMKKAGYSNRSEFIRDAVLEKFAQAGIEIPPEYAAVPSRVGVGGTPSHRAPFPSGLTPEG